MGQVGVLGGIPNNAGRPQGPFSIGEVLQSNKKIRPAPAPEYCIDIVVTTIYRLRNIMTSEQTIPATDTLPSLRWIMVGYFFWVGIYLGALIMHSATSF